MVAQLDVTAHRLEPEVSPTGAACTRHRLPDGALHGVRVETVGDVTAEGGGFVRVACLGGRAYVDVATDRRGIEVRAVLQLALEVHVTGGRAQAHGTG